MALSVVVYAGASMLAATPGASLRPHLASFSLRWRIAAGYLTEHPDLAACGSRRCCAAPCPSFRPPC